MADTPDPIADLIKDIEAEEAAIVKAAEDAGKPKADDDLVEGDEDAGDDEEAGKQEDEAGDKKPVEEPKEEKKGKPERMVPVSERNAAAAARRKAEDALNAALEENKRLKASATPVVDKDGKPLSRSVDEIEREAEERGRQSARAEIMVERFLTAGYEEHGQKEFDALCDTLADMGAQTNLVGIAIEATGSPEAASKAIYALSQLDPDRIEEILKLPVLRRGAELAKLVTARPRRTKTDEDAEIEAKPKLGKPAPKRVSQAEPPVRPLNGSRLVPEGLSDDVDDDAFTKNFDKMMAETPSARRH